MVGFLCLFRWVQVVVMRKNASPDQECLATFLLQVFGGAGAVWGGLEIVGIRVNYPTNCQELQPWGNSSVGNAWAPGYATCRNTLLECRIITGTLFVWFMYLWWTVRHRQGPGNTKILNPADMDGDGVVTPYEYVSFMVSTFILEVVGGVGALWGVSEVASDGKGSLRAGWADKDFGQPSFDTWRIWCALVGACCLLRWLTIR